jgi:HEAT repeat protein
MAPESDSFASMDARCDEDVPALVRSLAGPDGLLRKQARRCLIRRGDEAVDALVEALRDPSALMRTEAAEALLYIASPRAATALVAALEDKEFGVRWLAAEALISLRCEGVVPLLKGLIDRADSLWFRQAAHHVLSDHYCDRMRSDLLPVLEALSARDAQDTAPVAAGQVLRQHSQATSA